jgi:hypothetical protein
MYRKMTAWSAIRHACRHRGVRATCDSVDAAYRPSMVAA